MTYVIRNAHKARPDNRVPPMAHETDLGGMRLMLLPPGKCDLKHKIGFNTFDINLGSAAHDLALNSDKLETLRATPESIFYAPKGTELRLHVDNPLPGCVLEVRDDVMAAWMEAAEIPYATRDRPIVWRKDDVAADIGRSAIRHLMRAARSVASTDKLTVEALALGIATRGIAQLAALNGDIDGEIERWNRTGRKLNIDLAIDLIETRLCDSDLSISHLADAACLSSSRFSSVFRAMVGETPYAFILRRRAEYARDLIIGTREPLSQIAYDAGFSSQAHMTVVIRKVFGVTPAAMRN
ncbi:AraC family transcriptional regulator [Actibacterium sp. 188UL27-1]|uniref:helix-turn-helix transcriptional regulator n=1 Tax=Actibacterium sp. 188UL27-1 TaxID=2786961 RepID=UPI00195D4929|nr:AraC family transcriptional regulator [Actibacterium sp. 188UL27-1]MBM7070370.1 helix-turn-helix transcriptional regulator [Actibacterium sp. 188UL27-1]